MVESQGKVSEKSGNFEMDIEWQPCRELLLLLFVFHKKMGEKTTTTVSYNCKLYLYSLLLVECPS